MDYKDLIYQRRAVLDIIIGYYNESGKAQEETSILELCARTVM